MKNSKKGAVSAVTGGPPEDMNQMPPDTRPWSGDPVHAKPKNENNSDTNPWNRFIGFVSSLWQSQRKGRK